MTRRRGRKRSVLGRGLLVVLIASVIGRLAAMRMTSGDEDSDEFRLAAIGAGKQFGSRAEGLRAGSAFALMGGAEIDLREATLDPGGATLDVTAILGGVQVTLPAAWEVHVESRGILGGVDTQLTRRQTFLQAPPPSR